MNLSNKAGKATHNEGVSDCGCSNATTSEDEVSLFLPEVSALVAIGAAISANCEPCLRYHVNHAKQLGVSLKDIARAVEVASRVKETPHRNILKLSEQLLRQASGGQETNVKTPCCT